MADVRLFFIEIKIIIRNINFLSYFMMYTNNIYINSYNKHPRDIFTLKLASPFLPFKPALSRYPTVYLRCTSASYFTPFGNII